MQDTGFDRHVGVDAALLQIAIEDIALGCEPEAKALGDSGIDAALVDDLAARRAGRGVAQDRRRVR
jgi:hypothetical protein